MNYNPMASVAGKKKPAHGRGLMTRVTHLTDVLHSAGLLANVIHSRQLISLEYIFFGRLVEAECFHLVLCLYLT